MEIVCNAVALSAIINKISKACSRNKNALPILQYILFTKKEDEYYLIASSEDMSVRHRIEFAEVEGEWHDFCMPIGSATSAIALLADQPITIDVADESSNDSYTLKFSTTDVNGKQTTFDSVALSSKEYPTRLEPNGAIIVKVPAKDLLTCIKEASKYVAQDLLRPVMNGVYLEFSKEQFTVVGSNGHVLYCNRIGCKVEGIEEDQKASVDIPTNIAPILSSCSSKDEIVEVGISDKAVSFCTSDVLIISTAYEGRYPNYNSVIPENNKVAIFNKRELSSVIRLVRNFAPVEDILKMEFGKSLFMELSTSDPDYAASARSSVTIVDNDNIGDLRIGMKSSSLLTCLSDIQTENVKMKFSDSMHAITIHEDSEESELLVLLMPMQMND